MGAIKIQNYRKESCRSRYFWRSEKKEKQIGYVYLGSGIFDPVANKEEGTRAKKPFSEYFIKTFIEKFVYDTFGFEVSSVRYDTTEGHVRYTVYANKDYTRANNPKDSMWCREKFAICINTEEGIAEDKKQNDKFKVAQKFAELKWKRESVDRLHKELEATENKIHDTVKEQIQLEQYLLETYGYLDYKEYLKSIGEGENNG